MDSRHQDRPRPKPPCSSSSEDHASVFDFIASLEVPKRAAQRPKAKSARGFDTATGIYEDAKLPDAKFVQTSDGNGHSLAEASRGPAPSLRPAMRLQDSMQAGAGKSTGLKTEAQEATRCKNRALMREPRRRTIYIPSDDTTILTIHPGGMPASAKSSFSSISMHHSQTRQQRPDQRALARAPKRAPLKALKTLQEENSVTDFLIHGQATGKENVPPGQQKRRYSKMATSRLDHTVDKWSSSISKNDVQLVGGVSNGANSVDCNRELNRVRPRRATSFYQETPSTAQVRKDRTLAATTSTAKLSSYQSKRRTTSTGFQKYRLIDGDISQPQMFEDSWLDNEETAITELINGLFEKARPRNQELNANEMRMLFLEMYQAPSMVLIYQRLKASLRYGTLTWPKETESTAEAGRFFKDVAIRQGFIDLWMRTYNHVALQAAAEIVVGRKIGVAGGLPRSRTSALEDFITCCLLHCEDKKDSALPKASEQEISLHWRHTTQRSLMLIILLDKAKEASLLKDNLFLTSSPRKCSDSVLSELKTLLLPWCGNIMRPLSQLGYRLHHSQKPLAEFHYPVANLATDFRDGIRLARLMELLVCPHAEVETCNRSSTGSTTKSTTRKFSVSNGCNKGISRELKVPCTARASRVVNCEIVLAALRDLPGLGEIANNVTADDLVDGHREKTLALLWSVVCRWGVGSLIDEFDLAKEVSRLARKGSQPSERALARVDPMPENETAALLQRWATAIASKHNLTVTNMSTSFADGRVFEAIVDEYRPYTAHQGSAANHGQLSLESKLKELGWNGTFASIFGTASRRGQYLRADFTTAALVLFCSRLLKASRPVRDRLAVLHRLASDCMTVVLTKNRILDAARLLQRTWRRHWGAKRSRRAPAGAGVDIWLS